MTRVPSILVHSPVPGEAERYADLVAAAGTEADIAVSTNEENALQNAAEAEVLLGWRFPKTFFASAPRLRWIHKISAGVEDVAFDPAIAPDVVITRSDGVLIAPRMVEYVLGTIFAITQNFALARRQQADREWMGYDVGLARGSVAGVAGLGDIGRQVCRGLQVNGLRVIGWRRSRATLPEIDRLYVGPDVLEAFAADCDFLILVLPATEATRHVVSDAVLTAMKPTAWLINIGRGSAVDEVALTRALEEGRIAGAALDVTEIEPLPPDSPLWSLENVLLTPHVSGPIVPEDVVGNFVENLGRFRRGEPLTRVVNRNRGY